MQDADVVGAEELGQATLPVSHILEGHVFSGWLPLTDQSGKAVGYTDSLTKKFDQARVRLSIRYIPVDNKVRVSTSCVEGG